MIKKMFKNLSSEAEVVINKIEDELKKDYQVSWYPSSGSDFRDLVELSSLRGKQHLIDDKPVLFIHTDYLWKYNQEIIVEGKVVFSDEKTTIKVKNKYDLELKFNDPTYKSYASSYVDFSEDVEKPRAFLLEMEIDSNKIGKINEYVLYLFMENNYFFEKYALDKKIKITHLVRVREGLGMGGCKRSVMNAIMPFLPQIGVKYLIIDKDPITIDKENIFRIMDESQCEIATFSLDDKNTGIYWSGMNADFYEIVDVNFRRVNLGLRDFEVLASQLMEERDPEKTTFYERVSQ